MMQLFKRYLPWLLALVFLWATPLYRPEAVRAQTEATATPTFRPLIFVRPNVTLVAPLLLVTQLQPTTVVSNVQLFNLSSIKLADRLQTTLDLKYTDQFSAKVDIQSPATMQMGDANVITLQVTPQLLAQASMVRAELKILHFDIQDDGQQDKTVLENIPVSWSWVISPQTLGSQQFFLAVSYENQQGSWVRWQNIPLGIKVALPPSITAPPPPADTSTPLPTVTATPTETNSQKLSNSFFSNPTAFLTILVTLLLGVLGLIIQSRKQK